MNFDFPLRPGGATRSMPTQFRSLGGLVLGNAVRWALAAALTVCWTTAFAQDTGTEGLARPKVKADGQIEIKDAGYNVRYYLQEGKDATDLDAKVYYEPVIYLETDEENKIRHAINTKKGTLTLFIRSHPHGEIVEAVRRHLVKIAKERIPRDKWEEKKDHYNIQVLDLHNAWLQSTSLKYNGDPVVKSQPIKSSFREKGSVVVSFRMGVGDARSFIDHLNDRVDQLQFRYKFAGVKEERCTARAKSAQVQAIDQFKKVTGQGTKDYVSRDQVVNIADTMIKKKIFETRCSSLATTNDLLEKLLDQLGIPVLRQRTIFWKNFSINWVCPRHCLSRNGLILINL